MELENIQATIREHSGNNQGGFHRGCGTFRQQSGNVQATIREHFIEAVEHSGDNQGTFRQQSGNVSMEAAENSGNNQGTLDLACMVQSTEPIGWQR
jgi:hypothetical protein